MHGNGPESCAIFYANIDYRQRDDFLHFQAHHGHVMCSATKLHRFAYVVDWDPGPVTKVQINTNKFYKFYFINKINLNINKFHTQAVPL